MNPNDIALPLEKQLSEELFERLEGKLMEKIIRDAKVEHIEDEWKMILEGHSYKISEDLTPEIYQICTDVKNTLKYEKQIDFYITNSSEFNAFAIPSVDPQGTDTVNLNSMLVERLSNDELRFVIGHEIGHLASENARINRLIRFVFPGPDSIPMVLRNKIDLWEKLAELTADRYGFLASKDIATCLNGFFKLSSGLDAQRLDIQHEALLEENERRIEYFKSGKGLNLSTHPINPVRIKAIQIFSQSDLYAQLKSGAETIEVDEAMREQVSDLISILMVISSSELDYHRKYFIASAGLIISSLDETIRDEDLKRTMAVLSGFTIFPEILINNIIESENVHEIFAGSLRHILEQNPGERNAMLSFLMDTAISDHELQEKEVNFVYDVGEKMMGFSRKEIAQMFAQKIRAEFIPKLF
jgi:Zn-dependent protease with chaperone function